ncbi:MAG: selenocysteine lyase/cysteine desulfurase [Candidatus Azotimanducaceae bacterium]|jgi:selenocysteine lyase/cysteine desulfurase
MPDLANLYHYFYDANKIPGKLEPGNANYELSYASGAIVDYLASLGSHTCENGTRREQLEAAFVQIEEQEVTLAERLLSYLRKRNDCRVIGNPSGTDPTRVATISFTIENQDPEQICKTLDEHGIAIRFGDFHARRLIEGMGLLEANGAVRVSMTHYNTVEEVDRLIAALDIVLP